MLRQVSAGQAKSVNFVICQALTAISFNWRTFSGFAGDNEFKAETTKLREIVKEKYKEQVRVHDNRTICIAYDPPYKLFNRRNEVMLIAK